ncbi:MAG: hypothetical protein M3R36_18180 [Bacteroidota bacterium]|nr:hypothetical protein [Bacteroidota bacterium]
METIKINNLTDKQWNSYLELLIRIKNKFGQDCLIDDGDWEEYRDFYSVEKISVIDFKEKRLAFIETGSTKSLSEYLISENGEFTGWIALKESGDECELLFDTIYNEFPDESVKTIFKTCYEFMIRHNKNNISYWTHLERKKDIFKKAGKEAKTEDGYKSKLSREDMKIENWKEIVANNKYANDLRLVFCHEIPEESYNEFLVFKNKINYDMDFFNPAKPEIKANTMEHLLNRIKRDREDKDPYYLFILYDGKEIAATTSLYIEISDKIVLNHHGALTAVNRKYRGKNLAKYMKVQMYLKVLEDYPDVDHIFTDTFPWNKYMYRINAEMGFKLYRHENIFEMSKEFLENYLKQ